jgi:hypothetical protein
MATYNPVSFTPKTGAGLTDPFKPFADAAYNKATSRLDPQFAQAKGKLDQSLVNRGIMPGNEAYNSATESFGRTQNDAYANARNESLAQALAAQGQAFNQDLASFGADQGERQFGANFGFQNERADFGDLMSLLGYGNQTTAQNNQTLTADQQRINSLLGFIPGMSPTPVDAGGAASLWTGQYNNQVNADASKKNAQYAAWAQALGSFL